MAPRAPRRYSFVEPHATLSSDITSSNSEGYVPSDPGIVPPAISDETASVAPGDGAQSGNNTHKKPYVRLTRAQAKQLSEEMDDEYLNLLRERGSVDLDTVKAHIFRALDVKDRYGISRSTFYRVVNKIGIMNHGKQDEDVWGEAEKKEPENPHCAKEFSGEIRPLGRQFVELIRIRRYPNSGYMFSNERR